jgi:hypothetical protein
MAQLIKKRFLSSEIISYFDDQIDSVEQGLAQELLDRASGDESTLQAAKDYTDAEVLAEAGLRASGDAALDTRITTLEGQVGDDLQAAIAALQAVDSGLQSQIDALEGFGYDQVVYVAKGGLDTNTGKQHSPFLTIAAAMSAITDASPTKRYVIKLQAGTYTESSLALKPNVFVIGDSMYSTRISGAVSLHSSFTGSADNRSGFAGVTINSAVDFNWATVTSAAGKIYCRDVQFVSTVNMYGHNNAIAQAQYTNCIFFGALTISGINVGVFSNNICFGNITLSQHPNGGMATILTATGGYCAGTITQTASVNDFNRRSASFLRGFNSEKLVINGPSAYADVDLISQGKQTPDILNGASLVPMTPSVNYNLTTQMIVPKATNSHNMGDWGKQWTWNFGYVHASTGTDLLLISYPSSYSPDSAGKSIGIYTDGAGLQENVDGGSIELATAAVSGTGVRGKITLDAREIDVTSKQIKNLADGTFATDAVNKGQLESAIAAIPPVDLSGYYTKPEVDGIESGLQSQIDTEKGRIDAILLASDADKDSFKEIVDIINSVDTENDEAFAGYVLSNDARVTEVEGNLAQEVSDRQAAISAVEQSISDLASTATQEFADLHGAVIVTTSEGVAQGLQSQHSYLFVGSQAHTLKLPDFADLTVGEIFYVTNRSTQSISVKRHDEAVFPGTPISAYLVGPGQRGAFTYFGGGGFGLAASMVFGVDGSQNASGLKIVNLGDGVAAGDAVNKGQLDALESSAVSALGAIQDEVDAVEFSVSAIDSRVQALEAQVDGPSFFNSSAVIGEELAYLDLDREYIKLMSVAVGRLAIHEGEDFTVSVVAGKTRLTWIGSLANPSGTEKMEKGDKVFWVGAY